MHFEPLVKLAPVTVQTMEENEEEVFKMYAFDLCVRIAVILFCWKQASQVVPI